MLEEATILWLLSIDDAVLDNTYTEPEKEKADGVDVVRSVGVVRVSDWVPEDVIVADDVTSAELLRVTAVPFWNETFKVEVIVMVVVMSDDGAGVVEEL